MQQRLRAPASWIINLAIIALFMAGPTIAVLYPCDCALFHYETVRSVSTTALEISGIAEDVGNDYPVGVSSTPSFEANEPLLGFFGKSVATRGATTVIGRTKDLANLARESDRC